MLRRRVSGATRLAAMGMGLLIGPPTLFAQSAPPLVPPTRPAGAAPRGDAADRGCRLLEVGQDGEERLSPWMRCDLAWDRHRPGVLVLRQLISPQDDRRAEAPWENAPPRGEGPDGCISRGDGRCLSLDAGSHPDAWGLWGAPRWTPCLDRDRDGWCDEPWTRPGDGPQTLPDLRAVDRLQRGQGTFDVWRWLGRTDVSPRLQRDARGHVRRVWWLDPQGTVIAIWTDRTADGIADDVEQLGPGGSWTRRMGPTSGRR